MGNHEIENLRKYGEAPFGVAVVHGGPGAAGEMAPVARKLSSRRSVLEPLQTARSLEEQVAELKAVLDRCADLPVTLIGFSWGAWLSFILAAQYPAAVRKLILVGSGPFEEGYARGIMDLRLNRLEEADRNAALCAMDRLEDPGCEDRDGVFARLGNLISKADACDPGDSVFDAESVSCSVAIFRGVWGDASELRRSGRLLALADEIRCPVVAIHGDYDPHPAEGVEKPLSARLDRFRFHLLEKCGHKPWIEKMARDDFYALIEDELE